jgi:hypothetical protein
MTDILKKIESITDLTESQKDRPNIKEQATTNLLNFLNGFILDMQSKNELQNTVDKLIADKIEKEIEENGIDGLNWGVIFKLKELAGKQQVESATPILKILENAVKQPDSPLSPKENLKEDNIDESSKITVDEYKSVKKMLKFIDELKITEFGEKENIE